MAEPTIRVHDLKGFIRELKRVDVELPREMRRAHKEIADDVADATRSSFASRGGSAPKVAPTVRGLATPTRAQIKIGGGAGVGGQVAMGNEFGSIKYRQFPPWRGSDSSAGYSLYPTLRRLRPRNEERFMDAWSDAARRAFPS